jgi:nitrite reductase/ring-hydroxylating ferredoxin subunit
MSEMIDHPVAMVGEVPEGGMKVVEVAGKDYVLFNLEGHFYALRDQCPHQGAAISCGFLSGAMLPSSPGEYDFGLEGKVVTCPRHRWKFLVETGESLFKSDPRGIPTAPVRIEGDQVIISVRAPLKRR